MSVASTVLIPYRKWAVRAQLIAFNNVEFRAGARYYNL